MRLIEARNAIPLPLPRTIGEHIRRKRDELKFTQEELALRLDTSRDTIAKWETGRRHPGPALMPRIIAFLGYDPEPEAKTFPERLRRVRRALGLDQGPFADILRVPLPTLRAWERGLYEPPLARLNDVSQALGALENEGQSNKQPSV